MPRPELTHPYVEVRQAASVIMLREAAGKLEVFVQHRATTMDFAAGAVVFPGGRTEPEDAEYSFGPEAQQIVAKHAHGWHKTSLGSINREEALTNASMMLRTGVREVEEETGIGLAPQIMQIGRASCRERVQKAVEAGGREIQGNAERERPG